ncbi:MAG: hypothetical protein PHV49_01010, partial [Alistipes sp.]|nr:hypothetical protein [Alistipes sp.]
GAWDKVTPYFAHYRGNTQPRDHKGYGGDRYLNTTGRNDIIGAQVARDSVRLYFRVETAEHLSPSTDRNWMILLLDIDRDKSTGWNGYDYIVNRVSPHSGRVCIERNVEGRWEWETVAREKMYCTDNHLEFAIERSTLKLTPQQEIDLEFKWNDNMQENGNIMDFYVNGDSAPGGRFNFVYCTR